MAGRKPPLHLGVCMPMSFEAEKYIELAKTKPVVLLFCGVLKVSRIQDAECKDESQTTQQTPAPSQIKQGKRNAYLASSPTSEHGASLPSDTKRSKKGKASRKLKLIDAEEAA